MKWGVKEPGKPVEFVETNGGYEELRRLVGGWIEFVDFDNGIMGVINEEGVLLELRRNIVGERIFRGTVVFVSTNKQGDTVGLREEQVPLVLDLMKEKPQDEFGEWLDRFLEEKEYGPECWTFEVPSGVRIISSDEVVQLLKRLGLDDKKKVRLMMSRDDYCNRPVSESMEYFAFTFAQIGM